ncbi:MAG: FprA family A-type flavoprotein [Tannerellaceae bacterium]|jgi:flavorubredoxin|nr:FprA family A-type flavoprotein [Tannerellaceae bacterium]
MKPKEIANNIYYTGVNDRRKDLFENLWPLPAGISYNSYLIDDEKTALIDTVDVCYSDVFLQKITAILNGRQLDYLVVNHMEPDHSGSIRLLRQLYPDVQIVGNSKTFGMLAGFYGITDGLQEVKEGQTLSLGKRELSFMMAPMVHWPEVMFAYDKLSGTLFSADAFGTYGTLDGGIIDEELNISLFMEEMIRYYANIVGKYGSPVQKAIQKASAFDIQTICSTHGPVWRKYIAEAVGAYERMSRYDADCGATILYGSMYGHTEQMAEVIASAISAGGVRNIALHNLSKSHASYVLKDIFKYKAVVVGSPTYSNRLFPEVESMLHKIETRDVKDRIYACFGSFTWAGAAVKQLAEFGHRMKWELVGNPVEQKQGITLETFEACTQLGTDIAARLQAQ